MKNRDNLKAYEYCAELDAAEKDEENRIKQLLQLPEEFKINVEIHDDYIGVAVTLLEDNELKNRNIVEFPLDYSNYYIPGSDEKIKVKLMRAVQNLKNIELMHAPQPPMSERITYID